MMRETSWSARGDVITEGCGQLSTVLTIGMTLGAIVHEGLALVFIYV